MNSKWLFQNYRKSTGELRLLEEELASIQGDCIPAILPQASNNLLGTEAQVLCSTDQNGIIKEGLNTASRKEMLIARINECRRHELLYESVLLILTDSEKWIVETHFVAGRTIAETLTLLPKEMLITSRSSLIRRINKLLRKADAFLSSHLDDYGEGEKYYEAITINDIGRNH